MKQVLIALDQLAHTLIGGMADETLSAMAYRREKKALVWFIDKLFFFDPQHCFMSYLSECQRRQLPSNYKQCHYEDWVV